MSFECVTSKRKQKFGILLEHAALGFKAAIGGLNTCCFTCQINLTDLI